MGEGMGRTGNRVASVVVLVLTLTLLLQMDRAHGATALCTPDPAWPTPDAAATADLLELFNQHRSLVGLPPLKLSPSLTDAASWKSSHMAHDGYLSHNDPAPADRSMMQRARDCGYAGSAGENIAYFGSATLVMQAWLSSPGHRANIEDPEYRVAGIAAARSGDGAYYWTLMFGIEEDAEVPLATESPSPTETPVPGGEDIPIFNDVEIPVPGEASSAETARDAAAEFMRTAFTRWFLNDLRPRWRDHQLGR